MAEAPGGVAPEIWDALRHLDAGSPIDAHAEAEAAPLRPAPRYNGPSHPPQMEAHSDDAHHAHAEG